MGPLGKIWKRAEQVIASVRRSGTKATIAAIRRKIREDRDYRRWLEKHGSLDDKQRAELRVRAGSLQRKLISVILPVYNVDERWLRRAIGSVIEQVYPDWELCIADDHSTKPHVRRVLEEFAARDSRIKVVFRDTNGHISAASNTALEMATGKFAVLLDHDDELSEDALFRVAEELDKFPDTAMIYSDEDLIDEHGRRYEPKFKPDWSRDLSYSINIITHLSAYRTAVLREIGGFRTGFEGSQDYDLALRVTEKICEDQIKHIPRILYHWRAIRGSLAYSGEEKPYAHENAREALREHLERTGKAAEVVATADNLHRVRYAMPQPPPKVSLIVISGRPADSQRFAELTDHPNLEIITAADTAEALNASVGESSGEILCFADCDLRPRSGDWLGELVSFAIQNEIGAVGGKLISQDGTVEGSGLIIGAGDIVSPANEGLPANSPGNMTRNRLIGNYSTLSRSCLAMRRKVFDEIGGFNAESFANSLFDVDLCLRLREKGYRIVFTPYAELTSSAKDRIQRPSDSERLAFKMKWEKVMNADPFYNPNLSKKDGSFSIDI